MKKNKKIFSIVVVIIILAFIMSFFGSAIYKSTNDTQEENEQAQPTDVVVVSPEQTTDEPSLSNFMQSIKDSMEISDTIESTAKTLVGTINVYNTLHEQKKIISFDGKTDEYTLFKQKLIDEGIYFSDIDSTYEKDLWTYIQINEQGVAKTK